MGYIHYCLDNLRTSGRNYPIRDVPIQYDMGSMACKVLLLS